MNNASKRKSRLKSILLNIAGVAAALVAAEICLVPFATGKGSIPAPDQALVKDTPEVPAGPDDTIRIKQFQEGFGTAHFAPDGRRLTGNDEVAGAPSGVVIGDSFVEALQVNDGETMGSEIERLSRSANSPVNVRQYGWGGTSIATYLAVSQTLNEKWHPDWVAVLFNDDDFTEQSFSTGRYWRMEIDPASGEIKVIPVQRTGSGLDPVLGRVGLSSGDLRNWLNKSTLAYLSVEKYLVSGGNQGNSAPADPGPDRELEKQRVAAAAMVKALKHAYPKGLLVVFVPQIAVRSDATPQPIEQILARACENEGVNFVSTRSAMIDQRDREETLPEGFVNTIPGGGHLNRRGHQVVASEIWRAVTRNN